MKSSRSRRKQEPAVVEEEDEIILELSSESQDDSVFQPVHSRSHSRSQSTTRRSSKPKVDMRKIRVKVHFIDDIRYILIPTPTLDFDDFESRVREKFGIKGRMKIRIKDMEDEDMVTMGDQDDLDMLVTAVKSTARKERSEMGKLEVSLLSTCELSSFTNGNVVGLGARTMKFASHLYRNHYGTGAIVSAPT